MANKAFIVLGVLVVSGIAATSQTNPGQKPPLPSDDAEIRRLVARYADARQKGDGPAQAQFYTEDADEWRSSTRKMVTGRAEMAKDLVVAPSSTRKFTLQIESLRFVMPNVAILDTASFGTAAAPNTHGTYVVVKANGKWLFRAARIFRYPEAE